MILYILTWGIRRSVQLHAPAALTLWNNMLNTLYRRVGRSQSRFLDRPANRLSLHRLGHRSTGLFMTSIWVTKQTQKHEGNRTPALKRHGIKTYMDLEGILPRCVVFVPVASLKDRRRGCPVSSPLCNYWTRGGGRGLFRSTLPTFLWRDWGKLGKVSIRKAGNSDRIWNGYFTTTSPQSGEFLWSVK